MREDTLTLGWAVLGTGRVADRMTEAIRRADGATPVVVLSRDPARGRAFADKHGVTGVATDLSALLTDDAVDVVYVASPNAAHEEQVTAAAAAGKHVLCEKPLAMTAAACRSMIDACARAGVVLGTAFQFRHAPAHLLLRDLVATGALGRPVLADAAVSVPGGLGAPRWYADPNLAGGGILPMSGVHRIDLLRFVLGAEVAEVAAMIDPGRDVRPDEQTAVVVLRFTDGTLATLRCAFGAGPGGDPVTVHGTAGSAEGTGTTAQWWGADGGRIRLRLGGSDTETTFDRADLYLRQVDDFCAAVRDGKPPAATGADGLRAACVVEAVYTAAATGATVAVES